MIVCNGFPKSGNHALQKAMELLGIPARVNHIPHSEGIEGKCVFIKRDPRNVIVSWLRQNRDPVTPGKFLSRFRLFDAEPLIEEMAHFEGWLTDAFVVRYEDLIASDKVMRAMAKFAGVPYLSGAWEDLPNHTRTWNAVHSDYRTIWTPEVRAAWAAEGGMELLERWGY